MLSRSKIQSSTCSRAIYPEAACSGEGPETSAGVPRSREGGSIIVEGVFVGMVGDFLWGFSLGGSLGVFSGGFSGGFSGEKTLRQSDQAARFWQAQGIKPRVSSPGYQAREGASGGSKSPYFRKIGGIIRAHSGEIS